MSTREALTIRIPAELLAEARQLKTDQESFNELMVKALGRELRRRRGLQAYSDILDIQEDIRRRTGSQPDSDPLIRALREGTEPHV